MLAIGHYLLLLILLVVLWLSMHKAAIRAGRAKSILPGYIALAVIWVSYVLILSASGFLADFSVPPKLVLFVVIPAFVLITLFFSLKKFRDIIDAFPIELTVYIQSFRVAVELLIWGLVLEGIGPELLSFEGRNLDILAGLTAPVIAYLAYNRKVLPHKAVIIWNICCIALLANIVFMFVSLTVRPQIWGYETTPLSMDITRPPYVFIAGAFMPVAVFLHVFSIRKCMRAIKQKRPAITQDALSSN